MHTSRYKLAEHIPFKSSRRLACIVPCTYQHITHVLFIYSFNYSSIYMQETLPMLIHKSTLCLSWNIHYILWPTGKFHGFTAMSCPARGILIHGSLAHMFNLKSQSQPYVALDTKYFCNLVFLFNYMLGKRLVYVERYTLLPKQEILYSCCWHIRNTLY